jgi:hypothetical protein
VGVENASFYPPVQVVANCHFHEILNAGTRRREYYDKSSHFAGLGVAPMREAVKQNL